MLLSRTASVSLVMQPRTKLQWTRKTLFLVSQSNIKTSTKSLYLQMPNVSLVANSMKRQFKMTWSTGHSKLSAMMAADQKPKLNTKARPKAFTRRNLVNGLDQDEGNCCARFEELCADLFRNTMDPVKKALRDAKVDKSQVHEIVLVGGSTAFQRFKSFWVTSSRAKSWTNLSILMRPLLMVQLFKSLS